MGFRARIKVVGIGGGIPRDIENVTAESSDPEIFLVEDPESPISPAPPPDDEIAIRAVSVGTATLTIRADSEPDVPDVPLTDTVTIIVYRVATRLVLYYTEAGSTDELLAPLNPALQAQPKFTGMPFNTTYTLRIEGRDGDGNVVPLENITWDNGGSIAFHFADVSPADPYRKILTPDDNANDRIFIITADGDPSPTAVSLSLTGSVTISTSDLLATILTETYSIEHI